MRSSKVRIIVTTQSAKRIMTNWYAKGSPEAVQAMLELIRKETDILSVDWEETEEAKG